MVLREDPGVCPLFILWHICGAQILTKSQVLDLIGRSGEIRTPDPLLPKQVRYQAALRSDTAFIEQIQRVRDPRGLALLPAKRYANGTHKKLPSPPCG